MFNPNNHGVKAKLELNDEDVYLKGLNELERREASVSLVRGNLQVTVKSRLVHVNKVQIKFIGYSSDIIYNRSLNTRSLRESDKKTIVNDSYEFELQPFELVKGVYNFPFQFILEPDLPETVFTCLGNRHYMVEGKLIFKDQNDLKLSKPIKIIRCPLEDSPLLAEGVHTSGAWRDYMKYEISVFSKYMVLGDVFKVTFKLKPFSDFKMCSIDSIDVYFIQQLKCEKRSDFVGDNDVFELTNKCLIKRLKPKEKQADNGLKFYNDAWTIKLPKSVPFDVHPFLTETKPPNEFETQRGLRVSHFIRLILSVVPVEITRDVPSTNQLPTNIPRAHTNANLTKEVKPNEPRVPNTLMSNEFSTTLILKCEVYFKAPVRLLAPSAIEQPTPPTYEEAMKALKLSRSLFFNPLKIVKRHMISLNETYFPPAYN